MIRFLPYAAVAASALALLGCSPDPTPSVASTAGVTVSSQPAPTDSPGQATATSSPTSATPPAPPAGTSPAPTNAGARAYNVSFVRPDDALEVHSGVGTGTPLAGRLQHNASGVRLLGPSQVTGRNRWVQIEHQGLVGWVNRAFLTAAVNPCTVPEAASAVAGFRTALGAQRFDALAHVDPVRGLFVGRSVVPVPPRRLLHPPFGDEPMVADRDFWSPEAAGATVPAGRVLAELAAAATGEVRCDAKPPVNWGPVSTTLTGTAGQDGFMGAHYWLHHLAMPGGQTIDTFFWVDLDERRDTWVVVAIDRYEWSP